MPLFWTKTDAHFCKQAFKYSLRCCLNIDKTGLWKITPEKTFSGLFLHSVYTTQWDFRLWKRHGRVQVLLHSLQIGQCVHLTSYSVFICKTQHLVLNFQSRRNHLHRSEITLWQVPKSHFQSLLSWPYATSFISCNKGIQPSYNSSAVYNK